MHLTQNKVQHYTLQLVQGWVLSWCREEPTSAKPTAGNDGDEAFSVFCVMHNAESFCIFTQSEQTTLSSLIRSCSLACGDFFFKQ